MIRRPDDGQFKMEDRAAFGMRLCPQPSAVHGDDGPADGEAHAEAVRLGGEEGLEQTLDVRRQSALGNLHAQQFDVILRRFTKFVMNRF